MKFLLFLMNSKPSDILFKKSPSLLNNNIMKLPNVKQNDKYSGGFPKVSKKGIANFEQ